MVKHIVLWKFKSPDGDSLGRVKRALEAQNGRIPGLIRIEAGASFNTGRRGVHFALYSEFESREALAAYHRHPAHAETRAIVDPLADEHWIADYET
ncbi:MAG: Dabb family protein [Betaproteobacteria bacterium]